MRQPANFVIPVPSVEEEGLKYNISLPPMRVKVTDLGIYMKREVVTGIRKSYFDGKLGAITEIQRSAITWQDLEEIIFAHFEEGE